MGYHTSILLASVTVFLVMQSTSGFMCPTLFDFYPDPANCSKFYRCFWGAAYQFDCPTGTRWNHQVLTCDFAFNVNCPQGYWETESEDYDLGKQAHDYVFSNEDYADYSSSLLSSSKQVDKSGNHIHRHSHNSHDQGSDTHWSNEENSWHSGIQHGESEAMRDQQSESLENGDSRSDSHQEYHTESDRKETKGFDNIYHVERARPVEQKGTKNKYFTDDDETTNKKPKFSTDMHIEDVHVKLQNDSSVNLKNETYLSDIHTDKQTTRSDEQLVLHRIRKLKPLDRSQDRKGSKGSLQRKDSPKSSRDTNVDFVYDYDKDDGLGNHGRFGYYNFPGNHRSGFYASPSQRLPFLWPFGRKKLI